MKKLAIITTHPIQYYAPIFKLLQQRQNIYINVFYSWGEQSINKFDPGFGKQITWDLPLLIGYPYQWVNNISITPGSHHYKGIINPGLIGNIEQYQPDAILVFGWAYHSHFKIIRHFKNKVPVFFRGDSTLLDEKRGIKALLKLFFLKWVYGHISHAFYVGTNNKAYFKKYALTDRELSFAPHAIDNERFATDQSQAAAILRKRFGIKDDETVILFAGKFEHKKSPLLLAQSFIKLNRPATHLLFVGNGELEDQLKLQAADIANIHFMDFQNQSDIPAIYQACDLFCLPSNGPGETWGLSVNEAMACNKAILVSDKVGCAVDLVKENYNGAIFKNNDEKSLTEALNVLTRSKTVLQEYGKNSGIIIQKWNFTAIAEAIENKLLNEPD